MSSASWDFDYAPIPMGGGDEGGPLRDLVLATVDDIDPVKVAELLAGFVPDVTVTPLFSGYPIFWTRIESSQPIDRDALTRRLMASGAFVRYLASARHGSQRLAPHVDCAHARPRRATDWKARQKTTGADLDTPWRWFLRNEGANVVRNVCGTGAGTRLAIIDNDGRDLDRIELDAEVMVGVETVPRAAAHAALLLGWAVGAERSDRSHFRGVAPDASPRFYCIPKAADDVLSLPLAILKAVDDGADVVVCATYVEGLTSPLLDDALQVATTLGRDGKGAAIVFPTGREMSSPSDSIHSSLSLGMGEPASDPRVFCAGPSARDGDWFLWRDRQGKLRPFANRGPAVRCLAPGDDMAYPFASDDRPGHAESSGAAAIAAGVLLLAFGCNPHLQLRDLDALLIEMTTPVDSVRQASECGLADRHDIEPFAADDDGHNAKHGYGRVNAAAICLAACDPVALALLRMGEHDAALQYYATIIVEAADAPYAPALGRWAARVVLHDGRIQHALAALLRAVRLSCRHPERAAVQPAGHLLRHAGVIIRMLHDAGPNLLFGAELADLERKVQAHLDSGTARDVETRLVSWFTPLFAAEETSSVIPLSSVRATGSRALSGERPPGGSMVTRSDSASSSV